MATKEQTDKEKLVVSRAGVVPDAELQRIERRIEKERRKLRKLEKESQNVFYGEEIDTNAVTKQTELITALEVERDNLVANRETQFVSFDKNKALENAYEDVIEATNRLNELRTAAESKEEVIRGGGKGFVIKEKPTPQVVAEAEQKLKDAQQRVKEVASGKTAEELAQEAGEPKPLRGSAGTQGSDFGTVSGEPKQSTTPLMDGMVNIGSIEKPTVINLPGGETISGSRRASSEPESIDFAKGIFYSTSKTGEDIRNRIRQILAENGIADVSDAKLQAYWADAVSATAAANQADNPNQTVWDTLGIIAKSTSGSGTGTGPSAEAIKARRETVKLLSTQLGVKLTDNQINDLAYRYANGELDATTINFRIAKIGEIDFAAGEAANTLNELKIRAADYGILYGSDWYNQSAKKILTGEIDQDTINQQIMDLAKSQFPTLSARIDEGYTVKQLASPYIQSMAALLEINPADIGLQDLTIKQALTGIDQDGKPNTKPLWMFEQELRKDPRWNYTKNAQEATMGVARKILQDFGLAY
jgi:hypothetical protein